MSEPFRVLLADDHILFRQGLAALLAKCEGIEVVGEADNGLEAVSLAKELMPDIILMDIAMPVCDGLEATRRISRELPYIKVMMLTASDADQDVFESIQNGARGYLIKDIQKRQLCDAITGIARGEAFLSGSIASRILDEFKRPSEVRLPQEDSTSNPLTDRESEVLKLLVEGLSNREIAKRLVISENTVKNHLSNILSKLHLRNRIQMAVYAVREGLVGQQPPGS